jgi:hypothetical protein
MDLLSDDVRVLGVLRSELGLLREKHKQLDEAFNKEHEAEFCKEKELGLEVSKAEDAIRTKALEEFLKSKISKFDCGVQIKIFHKIEYDRVDAYNWALEHKIGLSLDKSGFEKVIKTMEVKPGFVKEIEEPQAQIPSKIELLTNETKRIKCEGGDKR